MLQKFVSFSNLDLFKHFRFAASLDNSSKQSGFNFQLVDLTQSKHTVHSVAQDMI